MTFNELAKKRRSIRAFSSREVSEETIQLLFEAARWAPSSRNEQPWKYYYAKRQNRRAFDQFIDCLNPGNQIWAEKAGLIILSVAQQNFKHKSKPNKHFMHDVGAANISLALQAAELGLQVHQMAGFNREKTIHEFQIDDAQFEPVTFMAAGYPGQPDKLPADLKKRESVIPTRKVLSDFIEEIKF